MGLPDLVGRSPAIARVREQVARVAARGAGSGRLPSVLLQGETGTGKGLVARALHEASARRSGPFVDINCAAIPEPLLEAELFGFERGAFTDARHAKPGLFQAANRGAIFLDEVALLPAALQGKLLKVIEEHTVRRLGATRSEPVDAWVIAATAIDLDEAARAGRFRLDLYHRLAVVTIRLPALRERGDDVLLLADHFLARVCADYGLRRKAFSQDARDALLAHCWPGNVRELSNVVERTALLADAPVLTAEMLELPEAVSGDAAEGDSPCAGPGSLRDTLRSAERERLLQVLHETHWNLSQAAARLALPRNTLLYRMERQGLRPPPPSRRRAPTAATSADVASLAPPAAAPGARRRLALLHAELQCGEDEAPLVASGLVIDAIAEKMSSFGGRVEEATSSHVTAVFGIEPVEDAPRRAALAALAVEKLAERDSRGKWPLRIGIHVPDCALDGAAPLAEDAGAREAWELLAATTRASAPGIISVTPEAARLLERRFDLLPVEPIGAGRGLYRLTGPERAGFVLAGRITAFTGRHEELALLASRLDSVLEGRGQVVAVVGEPGMGKSRLLTQFRQAVARRPVLWVEGHCLSYATAIPYLPVLDIVRAACGIGEADGAVEITAKVEAAFVETGPAAEGAWYLLHLLGSDAASDRLRQVGPEQLKRRTFEALLHLLLEASRQGPIIVAVEDLHWIDKTSDEVLAMLVDALATAPILLAATYRPGYEPPWLSRSYVTQLALPRLSNDDSLAVLRSTLADRRDVPVAALADLAGRGDGNPFFLEELAKAFDEHGGQEAALAVPGTIEGVLGGRIDRLLPSDKRLLQTAAVIGRDVPLAILRAVAEESEGGLRSSLDRLRAAEFLYDARPGPDAACTFKHALTQEVAYQTLTREQRRELHSKVADALRTLSPDFAETRPGVLARHLTASERGAEALPLWLRAGQDAIRRSANVEAVSHLRSALALLRREGASPERDRRELDLQLALGAPLVMTQGYASAEVEALYRRAEVLCEQLCEPSQLFSALWGISIFHVVRGDLHSARAVAERLLAAAARSGSDDLRVEAHLAYGAALFHQGLLSDARAHLEQCVSLYDPERHAGHAFLYGQDPCVAGLGFLGRTLVLLGHEAEADACIERGLRRAEAIDHPFTRTFALLNAAQLYELRGDFPSLLPYAEQAIALATQHRFPFLLGAAVSMRGQVLVAAGSYAEGLRLIKEGVHTWRATGASLSLAYYLGVIADAHRAIGEREEGLALITEALASAARSGELISETDLHRIHGELLAGDPATEDEAPAAFARGIALARRQGARLFARRAAASFRRYLSDRGRDQEAETLTGAWG